MAPHRADDEGAAMSPTTHDHRRPERAAVAVLLAATAGATDVVALIALGGAFAGVVTGNLVTLGDSVATTDTGRLAAIGVAVAGFTSGVLLWGRLWRARPGAVREPLLAQTAVLAAALAVDVTTGAHLPVLLLAALTMGAQSAVGLRLGVSTTYMTGVLTTAAYALGSGEGTGRARVAVRQLAALVAGAASGGYLLHAAPAWALALPAATVAAAAALSSRPAAAGP